MPSIDRNSASARLLARVLAAGTVTLDTIAERLEVPVARVEAFVSGGERMPLALQVRFAAVVEQATPQLARDARRLRAQAQAAEAMDAGATIVHARPPEGWR